MIPLVETVEKIKRSFGGKSLFSFEQLGSHEYFSTISLSRNHIPLQEQVVDKLSLRFINTPNSAWRGMGKY